MRHACKKGFSRLSPQSIYMRFLKAAKALSDKQARELANVDYIKHMALVGTIQEDGAGAFGRSLPVMACWRQDEPGLAEAAIVVRDDYQKRGLGKISMKRLLHYAGSMACAARRHRPFEQHPHALRFIRKQRLALRKEDARAGSVGISASPSPSDNH